MKKSTRYGWTILSLLLLCMTLPVLWLEIYRWKYCLFPPSGPNVEVVVSACVAPRLYSISPDGKYMLYLANVHGEIQPLLKDTITDEEHSAFSIGRFWLTTTLFLDDAFPPETKVADLSDETLTSLQWVQNMEGTTTQLVDGSQKYSQEVVQWFQGANQVYYISPRRWAVALSKDFKAHPENNYILANKADDFSNSILKFLQDNKIAYEEISYPNNGSDLVSHNKRFVMPSKGSDGFYTIDGTRIGPFYDFIRGDHSCCVAYGWAYDDSGIYVQGDAIGEGGMFPFPPKAQPILKLDLPSNYLTPMAREIRETRQMQVRLKVVTRVSMLILLFAIALWFFWKRRRTINPKHVNA